MLLKEPFTCYKEEVTYSSDTSKYLHKFDLHIYDFSVFTSAAGKVMKMHGERTLGSDMYNNNQTEIMYHVSVVKPSPIKLNVFVCYQFHLFRKEASVSKHLMKYQQAVRISLFSNPVSCFIVLSGLRPQLSIRCHSQYYL